MELIRGIHNLQPRHHGCVLTIGNFDGFHRGHQALIAELQAEGRRRGLPVMVMIFEPQPQEHFAGDAAPARLTRLRDKVKYLAAAGVDAVVCVTFYKQFAAQDRLMEAEMLLGHPYSLSGRVVHGDALGRTIGYPTANVSLKGRQAPINGVYAVEVYGIADRPLPGVANIGTRPTVAGLRQRLEVHLLDVDMNLYGCHIEVVIRAKVRNEQRFASLDDLKRQIANDVMSARDYFGLATPQ